MDWFTTGFPRTWFTTGFPRTWFLAWGLCSSETIVIAEARPGHDRAHDVGTIPYRLDAVTQWVRRMGEYMRIQLWDRG